MVVIEYDLCRVLASLLPSKEDLQKSKSEEFHFVTESIQLFDALLPEREETLKSEQEKQRLS
jgi:hypothetical protein